MSDEYTIASNFQRTDDPRATTEYEYRMTRVREREASLEDVQAMFVPAFALHGKTVKGSMSMGEVYALDFTDGTHLWLSIKQDGGRVSIEAELREGPL